MAYSLYRLEFSTGLHIGVDSGGSSLDDGRMTIHSDTLFSALCCECAKNGSVNRLYDLFAGNLLTISDALPYHKDEFYLPKPVLFIGNVKREGNSEQKKMFKAIEYIALSVFTEYVESLSSGGEMEPESLKYDFGRLIVDTRVALKGASQSTPYNVAYWRFNEDSGLYIIVRYKEETALSFLEDTLSALGFSGIGGKQSVGLGKFSLHKCSVPSKLIDLLEDTGADYQMLLGTALPPDHELDTALNNGWYGVVRRGGFVRSETYSQTPLKKRTIYMLTPGSCLKSRFEGGIFDLADGGAHPVWRCGKTLFAGVRL
ncbi:MAG: type III-A CRISPR-associated RAMP protein Csm4 [Clostridia bacterium]|jgi:CRISPR-associated protein Csm4